MIFGLDVSQLSFAEWALLAGIAGGAFAGFGQALKFLMGRRDFNLDRREKLVEEREKRHEKLYNQITILLDERVHLIEITSNYRAIIVRLPTLLDSFARCFESIPEGRIEGLAELKKSVREFTSDIDRVNSTGGIRSSDKLFSGGVTS